MSIHPVDRRCQRCLKWYVAGGSTGYYNHCLCPCCGDIRRSEYFQRLEIKQQEHEDRLQYGLYSPAELNPDNRY